MNSYFKVICTAFLKLVSFYIWARLQIFIEYDLYLDSVRRQALDLPHSPNGLLYSLPIHRVEKLVDSQRFVHFDLYIVKFQFLFRFIVLIHYSLANDKLI